MQIIYTIYYVTLQYFKCINNMGCFEVNLTQLNFNRDIMNK